MDARSRQGRRPGTVASTPVGPTRFFSPRRAAAVVAGAGMLVVLGVNPGAPAAQGDNPWSAAEQQFVYELNRAR